MPFISLAGLLVAMLSFLPACHREPSPKTDKEMAKLQEPLVKVNRLLVKKDRETISKHVERYRLQMEESPTGLWFRIIPGQRKRKAAPGDQAVLKYKLSLLDGTLCYSTDSLGPEQFTIGKTPEVESGLTEGILMMHEGDKAKFILPPHLAHGLAGDLNVPPRSIIVYDVELLRLRNND